MIKVKSIKGYRNGQLVFIFSDGDVTFGSIGDCDYVVSSDTMSKEDFKRQFPSVKLKGLDL